MGVVYPGARGALVEFKSCCQWTVQGSHGCLCVSSKAWLLCRCLMSSGIRTSSRQSEKQVLRLTTWIKLPNVDGIPQGRFSGSAQRALLYALR